MRVQILVLMCLLLAPLCQGRTITVDDDWPADFNNIQAAINDANDGDVVLVAQGRYCENIDFRGKAVTVTSVDPNDPNVADNTVIDGRSLGGCVTFQGTETAQSVLTGFTITNGRATKGGGIYGGSPDGPGTAGTRASIIGNVIVDNIATGSGGGIANCDGIIRGNTISRNIAGSTGSGAGGGIWHSDGQICSNTISFNSSGYQGGGICGCFGTIENNLVIGNSTGSLGGGINKSLQAGGLIRNSTIVDNSAGNRGGGLCDCACPVVNCIIWQNTAPDGAQQNNTPAITYSCVAGGFAGTGNIESDPCFADSTGDYHLKSEAGRWDPCSESWVLDDVTSLCIDAGHPYTPLRLEPSPHQCTANMGAYGATEQASKSLVMASACCEDLQCAGQSFGDATCDGAVNLADLFALKANFGTSAPWSGNECCTDFTHDWGIDLADLFILKANFGTNGYSPSTGNQTCPP